MQISSGRSQVEEVTEALEEGLKCVERKATGEGSSETLIDYLCNSLFASYALVFQN